MALLVAWAVGTGAIAEDTQTIPPELIQQVLRDKAAGTAGRAVPGDQSRQTILEPVGPSNPRLEVSRLERILSSRAGVNLRQFGYEDMGVGRAVNLPEVGAIADSYVLGPGDQVLVSLRGSVNADYSVDVNRDGTLIVPRLAPLAAAGHALDDVRAQASTAVRRGFAGTDAYVSIGRLRQVSVIVSGEIQNPGVRILTALSTPVDAILVSGGVTKSGSLRGVRLVRGNRVIPIDLYAYLMGSGSARTVMLSDGDRIVVPPLGRTVSVAGWVRRSGIFELPPGASSLGIKSLIAMAGGPEVRGSYRLSLLQTLADGRTSLVPASEASVIRDGEILFVQPNASETTGRATLSGGTALAGGYSVGGAGKLSDVLRAPGALGDQPYSLLGIVSRKDPRTLLRSLVAFAPVTILAGETDMSLQSDDLVRVFSTEESRLLSRTVGEVKRERQAREEATRRPEEADAQQRALQTTRQARTGVAGTTDGSADATGMPANPGGASTLRSSDPTRDDIARAQGAAALSHGVLDMDRSNAGLAPNANSAAAAAARAAQGLESESLLNEDSLRGGIVAREQPDAANFEEGLAQPGGYAINREVVRIRDLASQLAVDPVMLENFLLDHETTIQGAVGRPGVYVIGPGVNLHDLVMAAGGTAQWADESGIELISTAVDRTTGSARSTRTQLALNSTTLGTHVVLPHDKFRLRQVFTDTEFGSVTVEGEVRFPGTYEILRGEHLSDLIARAGGLTDTAYPFGAIYLRHSVAMLEQDSFRRAANEVQDQLLLSMTRRSNARLDPQAFVAAQSFVQQLRAQKGLGRISVTAEPSLLKRNPGLDPLLEAGDVLYVPQRPTTVSVLGQVRVPGSYPYRADATADDYLSRAGGTTQLADESETFVVLPDGSAEKLQRAWLPTGSSRALPPGTVIIVPRDLSPLDFQQLLLDSEAILEHLAVAGAAISVIGH